MKTYRPKRITIRLTAEEHKALSELRLAHGGSYQGVVMDGLNIAYNLYDYAKAIRQINDSQMTYLPVQPLATLHVEHTRETLTGESLASLE